MQTAAKSEGLDTGTDEQPYKKSSWIGWQLVIFLVGVVVIISIVHASGDLHYDFGVFYFAARMVLEGHGSSLYDLASQHIFQARYGRPPELIFCSPPFVPLLFLPTAIFSIRVAFVLWTIVSITLLTLAMKSLLKGLNFQLGQWPLLMTVAFMPVAVTLSHGQLSIVVLAAYVFCYLAWRQNQPMLGGIILAVALVKFQLVAGFICVLLLKRKWRELAGFSLGCIPCVLLSLFVTGWSGLLRYPALLVKEEATLGVDPRQMASLRGLIATLTGQRDALLLSTVLSVVVLLLATKAWKDLDTGFCAALIASMLTSYHFNPQDMSLLVIPLLVISAHLNSRSAATLAGVAYVLPLLFWFLGVFSLMTIFLICTLVVVYMRPELLAPRVARA